MKPSRVQLRSGNLSRQQGVVLFIALIALVTIMLAAVALTRSVDTATVIAGNLAFKQSATSAGDAGVEKAIAWLTQVNNANLTKDPTTEISHAFNVTAAGDGYYSSISTDPAFIKADATWTDAASKLVGMDRNGNTIRYIIERMCREENLSLSEANCMLSNAEDDTGSHKAGELQPIKSGKRPLIRVTVRVAGPRNTLSFIQAFVF